MEERKLVELHYESNDSNFNVGDIFLGKVSKIMSGLNAAFLAVGHDKEAFLHYTDLGPNIRSLQKFTKATLAGNTPKGLKGFTIEPENPKIGRIGQVLQSKQPLLVQILKEPISTKGPRLNAEISLPGRYVVLTPFNNYISISKKIGQKEERQRLQKLIESIRPENFGVIVRTAAEGKNTAELHQDIADLEQKWEAMKQELLNATPPKKILSEINKTSSILRDLLNDSFNKILVNDKAIQQDIKAFLQKIAPDKAEIVHYYSGNTPIFDAYGVTMQIKQSFGKEVPLAGGGSLIIEHTEALHVVDVNSGHNMGSSGDQEASALRNNLEAATELARQLRLRDLGGIVVVDFIDLKNPNNRKLLYNTLKDAMKVDRARHTILPPSKFGILQLTRQRVRPEVKITTSEVCPTCNGTGKIGASILLIEQIERDLNNILIHNNQSKVALEVHPFVDGYLKKGLVSKSMKWMMKYKKFISIKPNENFQLTEYKVFDKSGEEIKVG